MSARQDKEPEIAQLLGDLGAICDTGFALAIHIRYTRPTLLFQTYAQTWSDHYSEQGYMMTDPVVRWGLTNTGSVIWDTLRDQDPEGVITAAVAHGLTNGWTYALGPTGSRTIAGLTKSGAAFTPDQTAKAIAIVNAMHDLTEHFDQFSPARQENLRRLL